MQQLLESPLVWVAAAIGSYYLMSVLSREYLRYESWRMQSDIDRGIPPADAMRSMLSRIAEWIWRQPAVWVPIGGFIFSIGMLIMTAFG